MQAAIEHQHQCHRMFRDGVGRVSGHSDNAQPVLLTGVQVHVIETGAAQRDQFDALRGQRS